MEDPASPPPLRRFCPTCKKPVQPGFAFCETCGTPILELSTCSKCGTRFLDPDKFCPLCGAPMIPGVVTEPSDSDEDAGEEETGTDAKQLTESEVEEIPEPGTDELPEDTDEDAGPDEEEIPESDADELPENTEEDVGPDEGEIPGSDMDEEETPEPDSDEESEDVKEAIGTGDRERPHHHGGIVREPDTNALLETFGSEYADDETLESLHKPKREIIDDALYVSPGTHKAPVKPRGNRIKIIGGVVVLAAILAAVYFIGLPMLAASGIFNPQSDLPVTTITPLPAITKTLPITRVATPALASGALIPQPTQMIPNQKFYFQVQKHPITYTITVSFAGSAGEGSLKSADITVSHPDGSVSKGMIQPLKGVSEITLDGSKDTDRVEILALMSSGETYRVYDSLISVMR